jgi:catechol 2,3-dioxygenase-like lactoylglutathione lyase family enzyme
MECCQIALSSADIARSHWWYREALGFAAAGERRHRDGPQWAAVPGLPEASFDVWCLVGSRPFFQIEMFEFTRPRPRPVPPEQGPRDIGYSMFGIHVADLDEALERVARTGGAPLTEPIGTAGARRVCLRDPDGILLELMEDHVIADADEERGKASNTAPCAEFASVSVRNLEQVEQFWVDVLGLQQLGSTKIHDRSHERLWGLDGASRKSMVLRAGGLALEFVEYTAPRWRPRPAGYLISDHGVLNVALGSIERDLFDATYQRAVAAGFKGQCEPWSAPGVATVVYLRDPQGMSVELLHVEPGALERMGFLANEIRETNDSAAAPTEDARLGRPAPASPSRPPLSASS